MFVFPATMRHLYCGWTIVYFLLREFDFLLPVIMSVFCFTGHGAHVLCYQPLCPCPYSVFFVSTFVSVFCVSVVMSVCVYSVVSHCVRVRILCSVCHVRVPVLLSGVMSVSVYLPSYPCSCSLSPCPCSVLPPIVFVSMFQLLCSVFQPSCSCACPVFISHRVRVRVLCYQPSCPVLCYQPSCPCSVLPAIVSRTVSTSLSSVSVQSPVFRLSFEACQMQKQKSFACY